MTKSKQKLLYILVICIIICFSMIVLVPAQETAFASIIDKEEDIRFVPDEEL